MNTPKIAALYASPIFNTLLRFPSFDTTTTLTQQVIQHALREARVVSEDGRAYHFDASHPYNRGKHRDDAGHRAAGFLDEHCTKRQADWLLSQLPGYPEAAIMHLRKGMPEQDTLLVTVWGYGREEDDTQTLACLRYGAQEDFETVLRGMAAIRRKRRKQAKKLEAQLRAYHQQQLAEAQAKQHRNLLDGVWYGLEKALTTAARMDEPGVPFMGDAPLTYEQQVAMGLQFLAVDANMQGMPNAFPVGTGMALKPVKRSRELVDGAVYLWRWKVNGQFVAQRMGRLDMSAKERGFLPLRDEAGDLPGYCWAGYGESGLAKGIKLYRVTHYTTRNGALVAEPVAVPLHQPQLREQRRGRRELQAA